MDFLLSQIEKLNGQIKLSTEVRKVIWGKNKVDVVTVDNQTFKARKILITVPVAVLKKGVIAFDPPLAGHERAFRKIEVGGVVKFLVEFADRIWLSKEKSYFNQMPDLNFLFSDAPVPTWWTQRPNEIPLLTGWLAGPVLKKLPSGTEALAKLAFSSLAYVFGCSEAILQEHVKNIKVFNWQVDPFSLGAYAYATLNTSEAIKEISDPVENTIYFAGEAFYEGAEMGTVEAALSTGVENAEKIIREFV